MRQQFDLFAVSAPGLEDDCAAELARLGFAGRAEHGGVAFAGSPEDVWRANLWLRCTSRVLLRFAEVRCSSFPELYRKALRLPWGRFVRPQTPLVLRVSSQGSRLSHTGRIAETLEEAIDRALGRTRQAQSCLPPQLIVVRFSDDVAQISLDSSGELLHRRGYRREQGAAPLRETLAAALLGAAGWSAEEPLWDPLCGSATLLIEAAWLALGRAPGLGRNFAFEHWPHFRPGRWQVLCAQARAAETTPVGLSLHGSDRDSGVLELACRNAQRAGVANLLRLRQGDFDQVPPAASGLILCNPPYGLRLSNPGEALTLWRRLGEQLRRCPGWRVGLVSPAPELARATGLRLRRGREFSHGGLKAALYLSEG